MKTIYRSRGLLLLLIAALSIMPSRVAAEKQKLRFTVTLSPNLSSEPVSGRLIVFMTKSSEPLKVIAPSLFDLEKVWVAAKEVHNLTPGKPIDFNPDDIASPAPLSSAQPGDYQVMALLDVNHSYSYSDMGDGDLRSEVIWARDLTPSESEPVQLALTKRVEDEHPISDTKSTKLITFQSPALSAFWGRPVVMRAGVLLPPSYDTSKLRYPVIYRVHGFGGSYRSAWTAGAALYKKMADKKLPEMINVYLDGTCPLGHHEFADSVNNGPWGQALTREFIPYVERKFRMDGVSSGRFLTGHSSGGWSTLWLQVNYPDVFGGTWSTSPDPVDFRSFSSLDLTKYPADNFYRVQGDKPRNIFRYKGNEVFSWAQYVRYASVIGEYGGQVESFEAVFSPRGEDGRPMRLFDRDTGAVNPEVQKAWQRYDISHLLVTNWKTLEPKLRGKIHVVVGTVDNFHLEEAVYLLRDTLKNLGSDATFEIVEGRDHMDLYQSDLGDRIVQAMYKVARPISNSKR
ncbi:MAG TPA: alpha/beta hydrolase [Pyrinomonadaceae bacterium]